MSGEHSNGDVPLYEHDKADRYMQREDQGGYQLRYGASWEASECIGHIHTEEHAMLICILVNGGLSKHENFI